MHKKSRLLPSSAATVCKRVHPEDIQVGDFLAPVVELHEVPTFMWPCLSPELFPPHQTIRLTTPGSPEDVPLRVDAVCLPFLLCQKVNRESVVLDVRRNEFFRLDRQFAKLVRKALRCEYRKPKRRKKRARRSR